MLNKMREEKEKFGRMNDILETKMANMKYEKAKRNKSYEWVYSPHDPLFGDYTPNMG